MLLEGSELTKEDRESQLYDDFEHFRQHKEESINDNYVRPFKEHFDIIPYVFRVGVVIDEDVYVFWQPLEQYIVGPDIGIVLISFFRI
nr:integrase, catalytic region, zinc finger, CCHC-type, peptidase aspartic, catalytic [Tanacetum cinerariifolium]